MLTFKEYLNESSTPGILENPDGVGLNVLKNYYPNEIAGLISIPNGNTVYLWVKSLFSKEDVYHKKAIKDPKQYVYFTIKLERKTSLSFQTPASLGKNSPIYSKIHTLYLKFK